MLKEDTDRKPYISIDDIPLIDNIPDGQNLEDRILDYQNWDEKRIKGLEEAADKDRSKLEFLSKINAENSELAHITEYELARIGIRQEQYRQFTLSLVEARLNKISQSDIWLIRTQRCINYYTQEILPLRHRLQELATLYNDLQKDIIESYNKWKNQENNEKRKNILFDDVEDHGETLNNQCTKIVEEIKEIEKRIEEKRKELKGMLNDPEEKIRNSLREKLGLIKNGKKESNQKENILCLIPPSIEYEKIDTIAALVAEYSRLEAEKHEAKIDLSPKESDEIRNNDSYDYIRHILGDNIIYGAHPQPVGVKVTEKLVEKIRNTNKEYEHAYGILRKLMDNNALDIYYSHDKEACAKTYEPFSEKFENMFTLFNILHDERKDNPKIERLWKEYVYLRTRAMEEAQKPEIVKKALKVVFDKHDNDYREKVKQLNTEFIVYLGELWGTLAIPSLEDWKRIKEKGYTDSKLREKALEEANNKYDFLRSFKTNLGICHSKVIIPAEDRQNEIKQEILREIGIRDTTVTSPQCEVPIVNNYDDKAEILRTIAAAQQVFPIPEKIDEVVRQGRDEDVKAFEEAKGQAQSDYNEINHFVETGPHYTFR